MIPSLRPVDGRHLASLRIAVFGTWIILLGSTRLHLLADLPPELVQPNGLARLLPVDVLMGSPLLLAVVQLSAILGCVLCVLGIRPYAPIATATVALIFVNDGLMKSIGLYDNHAQWGALMVALVLAISPAADAWSWGPRADRTAEGHLPHDRYAAPLVAVAALFALAYLMIGARRVVDGAVTVLTDDSMVIWSVARILEDDHYPWDVPQVLLSNQWMLPGVAVGFALVTIAEILTPFILRNRRLCTMWLAVMVPFHVSTLLFMEIFFWENLILIGVLFTGIPTSIIALTESRSSARIARSSTRRA
ncbi:MAG: hypothetical protein ACXIVQ_04360 [Acidimicrobiales bacterium]